MAAVAIQADPVDVALVAIDAELTAARLSAAATYRTLGYLPKLEQYDAVALRVRLWAIANDCEIVERQHGHVVAFDVIDSARPFTRIVTVYRPPFPETEVLS